jgi:hypothetical protein
MRAVFLHLNGTFVVLLKIVDDGVPAHSEPSDPHRVGKVVARATSRFSGALGIKFLFRRFAEKNRQSQRHCIGDMYRVHGECYVKQILFDRSSAPRGVFEVQCTLQIYYWSLQFTLILGCTVLFDTLVQRKRREIGYPFLLGTRTELRYDAVENFRLVFPQPR